MKPSHSSTSQKRNLLFGAIGFLICLFIGQIMYSNPDKWFDITIDLLTLDKTLSSSTSSTSHQQQHRREEEEKEEEIIVEKKEDERLNILVLYGDE